MARGARRLSRRMGGAVAVFAATFAFYRGGFEDAGHRLRDYVGRSSAGVLDEPATARALA